VSIELEQALVVSNGHIPHAEAMDDFHPVDHPRISCHQQGWIVYLSSADERPCPTWFRPIMDIAVAGDVSFVVFDDAGQVLDGVSTFDW
tara:strand:- start:212 stop:478 length:267 start_codon:yes stop_codon:yes gene_type:complete